MRQWKLTEVAEENLQAVIYLESEEFISRSYALFYSYQF